MKTSISASLVTGCLCLTAICGLPTFGAEGVKGGNSEIALTGQSTTQVGGVQINLDVPKPGDKTDPKGVDHEKVLAYGAAFAAALAAIVTAWRNGTKTEAKASSETVVASGGLTTQTPQSSCKSSLSLLSSYRCVFSNLKLTNAFLEYVAKARITNLPVIAAELSKSVGKKLALSEIRAVFYNLSGVGFVTNETRGNGAGLNVRITALGQQVVLNSQNRDANPPAVAGELEGYRALLRRCKLIPLHFKFLSCLKAASIAELERLCRADFAFLHQKLPSVNAFEAVRDIMGGAGWIHATLDGQVNLTAVGEAVNDELKL